MSEDTTMLLGEGLYAFGDYKIAQGNFLNSKQQGEWTYFHPTGEVRAKGLFVSNQKHGDWSYYHPNGILQAKGTYHLGNKIGEWKSYDYLGNELAHIRYLPGSAVKRFVTFYPSGDTSLVRNFDVLDGKIHGMERSFYAHGPICEEYSFVVDTSSAHGQHQLLQGHGHLETYFMAENPGGQLLPSPTLQYHGAYRRYHQSGHMWEHRAYHYGKLVNVFESKNQWGSIQDNGSYRDGNGTVIRYHQNGDTASIMSYYDSVREGFFLIKESGNRKLVEGEYCASKPCGSWTIYDINQKPESRWTFKADTLETCWLHNSGTDKMKVDYVNYLQSGHWIVLDFLGDTLERAHYQKGLLEGSYARFNLGTRSLQGNYSKSLKTGKWQTISPSGKVSYEQDYGSQPTVHSPPILAPPMKLKFPLEDGFRIDASSFPPSLSGLSPEEIDIRINNEFHHVWIELGSMKGDVVFQCNADETGMITNFEAVKYGDTRYLHEAEKLLRGMGIVRPARILGFPQNSVFFVSYYFEKI